MHAFSKRLEYYLKQSGKTRSELADFLGVGRSTVSMWLKNGHVPRPETLEQICKFFKISSVDVLLGFSNNKQKCTFFEPNEYTQEELEEINKFAEFLKYKRNNKDSIDNNLKIEKLKKEKLYEEPDHLRVQAAHERTDIEVTDEMRKHDDDIMNDENF